jgi:hypothetical protein
LAQIFEPGSQVLVNELSRANRVVTLSNDQVRKSTVKLVGLRDLCQLHQLCKVIDLSSNGEIVISQSMSSGLQIFASLSDVFGNLEVLLGESFHLIAEFGGFAASINFNLTC